MKYSTKLSDTIHILIFIALGDDEQLSSTKIAESIKTNPAYVRQLMATLKNAGIVVNTQGHANAALAKSADKINMYDIYRAVEGISKRRNCALTMITIERTVSDAPSFNLR